MRRDSVRRLVENELMFRQANEEVQRHIQTDYTYEDKHTLRLHFYCECSNPDCQARIQMGVDEYQAAHRDNKHFIALPGHEEKSVEKVVKRFGRYNVIRKYVDPANIVGNSE